MRSDVLRTLPLSLALVVVSGCAAGWRAVPASTDAPPQLYDRVRVTRAAGDPVELRDAVLTTDTVSGTADRGGGRVALALSEVRQLQVRRTGTLETLAPYVAIVLGATLVALAVIGAL